jgi:serine/threonine-protein kinase
LTKGWRQARGARFGPFELDIDGLTLSKDGRPVDLASLPSRVLAYLVVHQGEIVSREELRREIWGGGMVLGFDDRLNTCIATIRSALDDEPSKPSYIETLRGRGYRFIASVSGEETRGRNETRFSLAAAVAMVAVLAGVAFSVAGDTIRSDNARIAVQIVDPLSPINTDDAEAWSLYLQATALVRNMREADYREAVKLLESALERDPEFALAHARLAIASVNLSWHYADIKALERAAEAARRAVDLAPDRAEPWLALGVLRYYGGRRYDAALEALDRAEEIDPVDPEILSTIGWVLRRQGRWEESTEYLGRAAALDPHSMEIHRSLGYSYAYLRDYEAAERHIRLAQSVAPTHASLYLDLAELALLSGQGPEAAMKTLTVGAAQTRSSLAALILGSPMLGRVLGDRIPAQTLTVSHFETPREDVGDAGRTELAVAWLKSRHGDQVGARRHYAAVRDRLLKRERERPVRGLSEERANLALAAAGLGLTEEAVYHAQVVLEQFSPEWDAVHSGYLTRTVAEALALAGEHERALAIVAELLAAPSPLSPALLRVDPIWDPLREDPRFQQFAES